MRLNRTHLVPVLAIVAGGVLGASLSFGLLGSRSDDVSGVTLGLLYESSATPEMEIRVERPNGPVVEWIYNGSGIAASRITFPRRTVTFSRRTEDGNQDLYVIDLDGENLRRLTDQIAIVSNGQAVIYKDGETGQSYVVRFTDEEQAAFERIEVPEGRLGYVRERVAELPGAGDISN